MERKLSSIEANSHFRRPRLIRCLRIHAHPLRKNSSDQNGHAFAGSVNSMCRFAVHMRLFRVLILRLVLMSHGDPEGINAYALEVGIVHS